MLPSPSSIPPLRCSVYENVTVAPMLYVDADPVTNFAVGAHAQGKALREAHRYVGGMRSTQQLPPWAAQCYSTQEVIYGGIFFSQWGHFLTETLQRLWYAKENALPILWVGKAIFYANQPFFTPTHHEIFQKLGLKNEHIFLTQPTQFAKVHFPEPGFMLDSYGHIAHKHFLGFHEGKLCKGKFVYLSRAHFGECSNENALEAILRQRGWHIVYPEQLPLEEQLDILSSAEVCLMMAGSAQHSLLLTKNSATRFIIIPRIHNRTYDVVASLTSNNYYILHLKKTLLSHGVGAFKDTFSLDLDSLHFILQETENFTQAMEAHTPLLQKYDGLAAEHGQVPQVYTKASVQLNPMEELFYQAVFLYEEGKYKEAYERIMPAYEQNALEFFMYDYFFMMVEKYDAQYHVTTPMRMDKNQFLLQKISKIMAKNPHVGEHYIRMAEVLTRMQRFEAAEQLLHKALKKFPQWALPHAALAQMFVTQGQMAKAVSQAQQAFTLAPHDAKIKEVLAYCLHSAQHDSASEKA